MVRFIINNSFLNEIASRILSRRPNPLKNWIVMLIVAVTLIIYAIESLFLNIFQRRIS